MTSHYVESASAISLMARALRRLPDCDLGITHLRQIVYRAARFSNDDVFAFDAKAFANEKLRRTIFSSTNPTESDTASMLLAS